MKEKIIYKAAFSNIDITPDFQTSLIGCHRPVYESQGVLHKLYAGALLFKNANEKFCLISIDNLSLTVKLSNIIRFKIARILETEVSHVMINCSHTHSAPEPSEYGLNGDRYFDFICKQVITCVNNAMESFVPCKISWGLGTADIGENRRENGYLNDNRLGGLMILNSNNNKPIVTIFRVSTHANVLMYQNSKISSDYIGVSREHLSEHFKCPVMFLQGACGNIKPIGVDKINGGDINDLYRIANVLTNSAKKIKFIFQDIKDIQMFSRNIDFISDVPSKKDSEKISRESGMDAREWLKSCENLRNKGEKVQITNGEINFLKLNEGCICGVSEEIFCELALDVQKLTDNPLVFLNGYTNGCTSYLANREEWHKGGYEVIFSNLVYHKYDGHVMPYREETAEEIVNLVINEWNKIK